MSALSHKKNKIVLTDYNYRRDIEHRLLLADLSVFEVDVLREILNDSLKIPLAHLTDALEVPKAKLAAVIDKFIPLKLIKREGDFLLIDKEMRKYYEAQILKFDPDFEPGMDFVQGLLQRVPIQVLPQWYSIPRTSDNIFHALIEKFLFTPKLYEQYLNEIHFDNDLLTGISQEVFKSSDFVVHATALRKKFSLTPEQFEEAVLLLEFNFVCCLGYEQVGEKWEEVVTPFHEWREYLRFMRDTHPKKISDTAAIERTHTDDFGFLNDMMTVLTALQKKSIPLEKTETGYFFNSKILPKTSKEYMSEIVERLLFMHFAVLKGENLTIHTPAADWMQKSLENRALTMSRHPIGVEKGLHRYTRTGWAYVDDFVEGFMGILGGKEKITLRCKGKKWRYTLPEYSPEEKAIVRKTLCKRLFEAGIVATGLHKGKECFCVTSYGRRSLED